MSAHTRNGTDTTVGFIPGADIDEGAGAHPGGLTAARDAFAAHMGWRGKPALGSYTYPSGGASEPWDLARAQGADAVSYRAIAIPNGYTPADVHAGKCDQLWTARAADMVQAGNVRWFFAGHEGSDHQFNGSAGKVGVAEYAYAVSRQLHVMRQVPGWDPWVSVNFSVYQGSVMGLSPHDTFAAITEPYDSIDLDLYPIDAFDGRWSASQDVAKTWAFMQAQLEVQRDFAAALGKPIGIGEWAPMIRPDGHSSGDDPYTVARMAEWVRDPSNNVAHLWIYDGSNLSADGKSGDTCRFATYNGTAYADTPAFRMSAQAIRALFDPADYVGRPAPLDPAAVAATQVQLNAANETLRAVAALTTQTLSNFSILASSLHGLGQAVGVITPTGGTPA